MIERVITKDISPEKWKRKIRSADIRWLTLQYRGLKYLMDEIDRAIDDQSVEVLQKYGNTIPDDVYRDTLYHLESDMLDMDVQLVDVEEELERRGIDVVV